MEKTIEELGVKVEPKRDQVAVDGQPVRPKRKFISRSINLEAWCAHAKTNWGDPHLRAIPKEWGHLHSVGRLDFNSEGLLFLTNDGEFSLPPDSPAIRCAQEVHRHSRGPGRAGHFAPI